MLIGITGSIGSGKSTVGEIIKKDKRGFVFYSCDEIVHDLLENDQKVIKQVSSQFIGVGIVINNKKSIDRNKLGKIVFNDIKAKKELESIIHPIVYEKLVEINQEEKGIVFVEVPLLFEAKMENLFTYIITVASSLDIQMERLRKRTNYSKEEALQRINSQMDIDIKIKKSDFVIYNNLDIANLENNVNQIIVEILNRI